jgi:hypothetical protein
MKLLDQPIEASANLRQLFNQRRPFFGLLLISALLDVLSTIAFMSIWGPAREQTWIIRELSLALGILLGPPTGKLFQILAVMGFAVIAPRLTRLVCTTVILLNLFAFVANLHLVFGGG